MKKWLVIFKRLNREPVKLLLLLLKVMFTVKEIADHVIEIPDTEEALTPLLTTIPLQLLSYHIAVMLG